MSLPRPKQLERTFSRPALRAFITSANWSQGLEGYIGSPAFKYKTSGLNFGVQGKTWW